MQSALTSYAGASTTANAWNTIFQSFNGGPGYQPGEKVFIKVNLTTSYSDGCADANYNWTITCLGGGSHHWLDLYRQLAADDDRPAGSTGERGGSGADQHHHRQLLRPVGQRAV
ncbi:MAG: hypothetical protein V9H69_00565 [Anaerolineae bacterium]